MKTELEKMIAGEMYHQTPELLEVRFKTRDLLYEYNRCHPRDMATRSRLLKEMFHSVGEKYFIELPFHVDYGFNVTIGENFFANNNLTLLDVCPITIGDDVLLAPNVGIYTAGHTLDPQLRKVTGGEFGQPVVIGNNVWVGANVSILPGVTIGDDTVIGAGSVVTKDIPAGVLATGNPCRVIRAFDQRDRETYYRDLAIPQAYLDQLAD